MEPTSPKPTQESSTLLFRPSKKRKIYRQRARDDEEDNSAQDATKVASPAARADEQSLEELITSSGAPLESDEVEGTTVSMAEILRLRKRNKRLGGVEFRVESARNRQEDADQQALAIQEGGEEEVVLGAPRRFAPQTGTVGDVNKHMMDYIDSQLAKQRAVETVQASISNQHSFGSTSVRDAEANTNANTLASKTQLDVQRQPAALGKLQEVDLGADARWRNEERTRRKIAGERSLEEEESEAAKASKAPKKVRLGPDGKPWRSRRKRRASEDVARDRIVEEVMRENRLEIYDEPVQDTPAHDEPDAAADDRIAESFRQEFMDAIAQRRQRKSGPPAAAARTAAGKKEEEVLKGPKLGGSRNARAAMRDMMLKSAKK